jgi:hypothetical protein
MILTVHVPEKMGLEADIMGSPRPAAVLC